MTNERHRDDDACADPFTDELRRRLHAAVDPVRPAPDALARLRAAVPARRRRRRAAAISAAAAMVVLVVATPVVGTITGLVDRRGGDPVAGLPSLGTPRATTAGDGTDATPHSTGSAGTGPRHPSPAPSGGAHASPDPDITASGALPSPDRTATTSAPASAPPVPGCASELLEQTAGTLGPVGPDGLAYGTVVVRNTGAAACRVDGPGVVLVATAPGTAPVQVTVVTHRPGGVAARLPAPPGGGFTVAAGGTYEFQFAWQPQAPAADGTCPSDGRAASVPALGYIPARDEARVAEVALTPTCGGTLYRTDVYPGGAYPRAS